MNTMLDPKQHWLNAVKKLAPSSLPGMTLPWLQQAREQALNHFTLTGFPSTRQEDWKYTDLTVMLKQTFDVSITATTITQEQVTSLSLPNWQAYTMVFVDGNYQPLFSQLPTQDGVYIATLQDALKQQPALLEKVFTTKNSLSQGGFHALNTVFMQQGSVLTLADNVVLDKPLQLLFISTTPQQATYFRHVLQLGKNAQAIVVENHQTISAETLHYFNHHTQHVMLDANAQLSHYQLQMEHTQAYHMTQTFCQQQQDSHYQHYQFDFGSRLTRHDLQVQLKASGANCDLLGLYMPQGVQHVDNHTRIDHLVPHTQSTEYYKGVLNDRARAVFNGKIIVHEQAIKTLAAQNNHNLLLSNKAEIDTKPELEIYNDDVKCSHGATIGQLDPQALFYLRARGIDLAKARDLLIYGFAHDVVTHVELSALREKLDKMLLAQLPKQLTALNDLW